MSAPAPDVSPCLLRASVVVPTHRRRELLTRCVAALRAQDFDPAAYEILVADDENSPRTRQLVEHWATAPGAAVRYLPVTQAHGPAAARNAGWRAARGAIIAFTDDDCIPQRAWLRHGVAAFTEHIDAAWGKLVMPVSAAPTDYERDAARLAESPFVTANCFVRRSALAALGGFDERFAVAWREDSDLFFSLLERNATVAYVSQAVVVHPVRPAPWGVSVTQQRKNLYNALLYKKHPRLYRERIQSAPPWRYYGIVSALLMGVGGVLGARWGLALGAAGVWLTMTGRFCVQRLQHTSHALGHVLEMLVTSAVIPPVAVYWRLRGALTFRVLFF
jgi:glycosyltransferase involved in cell wall biosynthesis